MNDNRDNREGMERMTENQYQPSTRVQIAIREGLYPDAPEWADLDHQLALFQQPALSAEPVSIADMAPGTTVVASLDGSYSDTRLFMYMVVLLPRGKRLVDTDGVIWSPDQFDPSTIRDVTPPPATPEADR